MYDTCMSEVKILDYIQDHFRSRAMDLIMLGFTNFGVIFMGMVFAYALLYYDDRLRVILCLGAATVLKVLITDLLMKPFSDRDRPFVKTGREPVGRKPQDQSFPSGHTSGSFAILTAWYLMGMPYIPVLAVTAFCISVSRMYLYVHWPTDVLAGYAVGILSGWMAYVIVF